MCGVNIRGRRSGVGLKCAGTEGGSEDEVIYFRLKKVLRYLISSYSHILLKEDTINSPPLHSFRLSSTTREKDKSFLLKLKFFPRRFVSLRFNSRCSFFTSKFLICCSRIVEFTLVSHSVLILFPVKYWLLLLQEFSSCYRTTAK